MIRDQKLLKRLKAQTAGPRGQAAKPTKKHPRRAKAKPLAPDQESQEGSASPNPLSYRRPRDLLLEGATSPTDIPWVRTVDLASEKEAWIPLEDFSDDARPAKARLRKAGIYLFDEAEKEWIRKAKKVEEFPPRPLIDRPGWSGPYFALPNGEIFSPAGAEEAIFLFDPLVGKCAKAGDKTWLKGVKRLARAQPIVTFAVMVPFCAPLLRLSRLQANFGIEMSGPKARGKSTLQRLAASVAGAALDPSGRNYWITANTTMNALEQQMPIHNDMPMIIEEMSAMNAGESERVRDNRARELVFRMAEGTGKDRFQAARQAQARFVYFTSTNDPISVLIGANASDAADAAADRLLAVPISPERPNGVFEEQLPKGQRSGEDAARAIDELVSEHYGHPMRQFVRALVNVRAIDEVGIKRDIDTYIMEFRRAVGVDGKSGSEARVADAFGLIYAAGMLAQRFGALPKSLQCLDAAVYCHRLNRESVGARISNLEQLVQLADSEEVVPVDLADESKRYRKAVERAPALILRGNKAKRELLVTLDKLNELFPRWKDVVGDPEVKPLLRCDDGRNSRKVKVVAGEKPRRFLCLRLPDPVR